MFLQLSYMHDNPTGILNQLNPCPSLSSTRLVPLNTRVINEYVINDYSSVLQSGNCAKVMDQRIRTGTRAFEFNSSKLNFSLGHAAVINDYTI